MDVKIIYIILCTLYLNYVRIHYIASNIIGVTENKMKFQWDNTRDTTINTMNFIGYFFFGIFLGISWDMYSNQHGMFRMCETYQGKL